MKQIECQELFCLSLFSGGSGILVPIECLLSKTLRHFLYDVSVVLSISFPQPYWTDLIRMGYSNFYHEWFVEQHLTFSSIVGFKHGFMNILRANLCLDASRWD